MGAFSIQHWVVVLIIVMLLFGTKRLRNVGSDLGAPLRGFRESVRSADEKSAAPGLDPNGRTVDTRVRDGSQSRA